MGRELKRVSLDFNWPLNRTWGGYLNPYRSQSTKCVSCDGTGYGPDAKRFKGEWYGYVPFDPVVYGATPLMREHPKLRQYAEWQCNRTDEYRCTWPVEQYIDHLYNHMKGQWSHHLIQADVDALVDAGRLHDFTRTPRTDEQREIVKQKLANGGNLWLPEPNGYVPTADEVNAWSIGGMGHDSINQWVCVEARCKREGVEVMCSTCGGSGTLWPSPEIERLYDEWEPTEPPTGEGYQLWETTSEGSPISPVFETLDELCQYAALNCSVFGHTKQSAEKWREMLDDGFVALVQGNNVFI